MVDTRRGMFPGLRLRDFRLIYFSSRYSLKSQMSRAGSINCFSVPLILPTSPVASQLFNTGLVPAEPQCPPKQTASPIRHETMAGPCPCLVGASLLLAPHPFRSTKEKADCPGKKKITGVPPSSVGLADAPGRIFFFIFCCDRAELRSRSCIGSDWAWDHRQT